MNGAEAKAIMQTKAEMLSELKAMLRDVFKAREEGAAYARLARAHGYVDGYMRGLLETGTFTKEELLAVVADQRRDVYGPATTTTEAALPVVRRRRAEHLQPRAIPYKRPMLPPNRPGGSIFRFYLRCVEPLIEAQGTGTSETSPLIFGLPIRHQFAM